MTCYRKSYAGLGLKKGLKLFPLILLAGLLFTANFSVLHSGVVAASTANSCLVIDRHPLVLGPFFGELVKWGDRCPVLTIYYATFKLNNGQTSMVLFNSWSNSFNNGTSWEFIVLSQPFSYDKVCTGALNVMFEPLGPEVCWPSMP